MRSNDRLYKYGDSGDSEGELEESAGEVLRSIERGAEEFSETEHREQSSRHDQVRDINWTMTILANSIKVVSAVLTILAVDQTDR